jgi:hypothetical protein
MKLKLSAFIFFALITLHSYARTSGHLVLRANMPARYKVEINTGTPRLVSNVKQAGFVPELKVERRQTNGFILTIIHP